MRTCDATGARAAAAARAATQGLVERRVPDTLICELPSGRKVSFSVIDGRCGGPCDHAAGIEDAAR